MIVAFTSGQFRFFDEKHILHFQYNPKQQLTLIYFTVSSILIQFQVEMWKSIKEDHAYACSIAFSEGLRLLQSVFSAETELSVGTFSKACMLIHKFPRNARLQSAEMACENCAGLSRLGLYTLYRFKYSIQYATCSQSTND